MDAAAKRRNLVGVREETVTNVGSSDIPGHYPGEDSSWDLDQFTRNLKVQFHKNEPFDAVFSLIGVDPSVANAFRRILLAESPSLAIEHVFVDNNTGVIQDEVLTHRLGLVPLKGSREGLKWLRFRNKWEKEGGTRYDHNTVRLRLNVGCTWKADGERKLHEGITDPAELYNHASVYASDIKFEPVGKQTDYFSHEKGTVEPVQPDILLAKLRPGQVIDMICDAELGVGADHAKFSPVATAAYRLLPIIDILKPILGDDAHKFQKCFLPGVIGLEKVSAADARADKDCEGREGEDRAVVANAFKDTVSRECLRHPEFKDKVKLSRQRDHFIFSVESVGQWQSDEIFLDAVKLLRKKCARVRSDFQKVRERE